MAGFLDLPLELRRQIYRYLLTRRKAFNAFSIRIDPYRFSKWGIEDRVKSLVLVSKQISNEAVEILYGENIFSYPLNGDSGYSLQKNFSPENIQRIRKLRIIVQDAGCQYPDRVPDYELWSPILARLTKLQIVAKQPLEQRGYYGAPSLESEVKKWVNWFGPMLSYIAGKISNNLCVEMDYDDRRETDVLVNEHLPGRHRKVRTIDGDLMFKRGQFSMESGYWDDDYDGPN